MHFQALTGIHVIHSDSCTIEQRGNACVSTLVADTQGPSDEEIKSVFSAKGTALIISLDH